ncbi:MAG: hypothetical protein NBV67_04015 [Tagaea sp.]|nr:hypothetical protein [Tagaea sp.]
MIRKVLSMGLALGLAVLLAACQTTQAPPLIVSQKGAVELRAIQSRAFDSNDRAKVLRAVIATLQDLGYTIEKVEASAGTVTGIKLAQLRLTATVVPRTGGNQMAVRANAQVRPIATVLQENQVDDPVFYQQLFFEPLAKALFLTALQIEDGPDIPIPAPAPPVAPTAQTPATPSPVR